MAEEVDIREEVDIVRIDPLFLERQRNRYASRAVAFLVILNGVAALLLLANFLRLHPSIENAPKVADAMVGFGAGVAAALASMFFAYLRRTIRMEAPERAPLRPVGWWLALLAAGRERGLFCRWSKNGWHRSRANACEFGEARQNSAARRSRSPRCAWPSGTPGINGRQRREGGKR
jgi:hypothetical protein